MLSTFLSKEEVSQLTGAKFKASQLKQLAAQGFDFVTDHDGHPKVLRSAVEQRLGIFSKLSSKPEPTLFNKGV